MRSVSQGMNLALLMAIVGLNSPMPVNALQTLNQALRVDVQHHRGFERVTVATQGAKPVAEDHVFRVVSRNNYYGTSGVVYSKTLTIPRGKTSATTELYISNATPSNNWSANYLHIEQDGNERYDNRDLMVTQANSRNYNYHNLPAILFISSNVSAVKSESYVCSGRSAMRNVGVSGLSIDNPLPSFIELEPLLVQCGGLVQGAVTDSKSLLQSVESIESLMPTGLPRNWRGLAAYELAIISHKDLTAVAQSDNEIRRALISWVSVGGTLVVFDCGKQYQKAASILPLLTGQSAAAPTNKNVPWTMPGTGIQSIKSFAIDSGYYIGPNQPQITISLDDADFGDGDRFLPFPQDPEEAAKAPFAIASFVNGHIIAIPDDMQGWKLNDWQTLYNTHQAFDWSINKTIGSRSLASQYESGFSIPGVGRPPVIAFQVLIGLFVLVVGPGFYVLLYQSSRMHLLLILAPLLSLLACLGLFFYAIIHDGFDIRGRVHSVTRIDHQSGAAVTHARHAYYAGVSPQGYAFDGQTAVFDARRGNSSLTRFRFRDNDDSVISGGELKARNPHQLVSVRSFETEGRLSVREIPRNAEESQKFQIQNRFQNDIELAIVRVENQWLVAENLAAGSAVLASPSSKNELAAKLRKLVQQRSPLTQDRQDNSLVFWNRYSLNGFNPLAGQSDLLMKNFRAGKLGAAEIEKGGYVALMQEFNEVPDPQPQAIYQQHRLHIVIGKW